MSKVDAQRAMREAKYAREAAAAAASPAPRRPPLRPAGQSAPAAAAPAPRFIEPASAAVELDEPCGHRNMGGKTCSRPAGHSEKNHRYS